VYITITIETQFGQADIRIDNEQKIGVGLQVLRESGKLPPGVTPAYFRSHQNERLVSANKTYIAENIFDGDILRAIENK